MIDIIKERLRQYGPGNALEQENAVKEILQEIALYALSCIDCAAFPKTSTSCYGFLIPHYDWSPYLKVLPEVAAQFGLKLDAQPKARMAVGNAIAFPDHSASGRTKE